jgi:hypothetical protein
MRTRRPASGWYGCVTTRKSKDSPRAIAVCRDRRVGDGPERVVSLAAWLYSAVWHWYLTVHAETPSWPDRPWYMSKRAPSFADALAALRSETWSAILGTPARNLDSPQIATTLISVLANVA